MKLVSWNVNSLKLRISRVLEVLEVRKAPKPGDHAPLIAERG